eukprot:TRINITY_DN8250_c0_g1_i1.p1 TRINITY_DN8250_c0_g1~~TRINITY_DN8250_c0_g1_i1.p1  ORF type:complete len:132 (-),score=28.18 TRINITY_DN8250_c0_g1_i1:220-615(-)
MNKLALLVITIVSACVLEVSADGAYDYGSGAGLDRVNRKLGFDRGYIYFGVFILAILVILGVIVSCIVLACLYRAHSKRAMARAWRTKPGTRRLTELSSSPEKVPESQPPPYMTSQVEIPPSYSETTPDNV